MVLGHGRESCCPWPRRCDRGDLSVLGKCQWVTVWCSADAIERVGMLLSARRGKSHRNLHCLTVQGQLPPKDKPVENHQGACKVSGASLEERTLRKLLVGMVPQALAWENQICSCKTVRRPLPHLTFVPDVFMTTLSNSFSSWANTVLHMLARLAACAQQVSGHENHAEVPACLSCHT